MAKPVKKSARFSLVEVIREDKTYIRSKKSLERIMANIDVKLIVTELFNLQTTRSVAALSGRQVIRSSQRTIIDSSVEEMAVRSRCTTIKMMALQGLIEIEELTSHLSKMFISKYAARMRTDGYTTITAQRSQIDVHLRLFIETKKNLEYLTKLADLVIEDVDAAGWSLKRIADTIESSKKDR